MLKALSKIKVINVPGVIIVMNLRSFLKHVLQVSRCLIAHTFRHLNSISESGSISFTAVHSNEYVLGSVTMNVCI